MQTVRTQMPERLQAAGFRWQLCGGCGNLFPRVQLIYKQYINIVYVFKRNNIFKCRVGRKELFLRGAPF